MSLLRRILRDRRGVAAVEMALVAPVIAGLALASFETWRYTTRVQEMKDALKAGVQYYMNDGKVDADAQSIAISAWANKPQSAAIAVVRGCVCGTTAHACTTLCSNQTVPHMLVTLRATATYPQSYFASNLQLEQVVRVR